MKRWTCPNCQRVFGKKNQSHLTCEPGFTLDEYFAQARSFERPIYDAVIARIGDLEGLIIDPLNVGILLKNGPMFAELRPKTKWTAVGLSLGRKIESDRWSRKISSFGKKHFHVINVTDPEEIDEEVHEWLLEGYHFAGGTLNEYQRWRFAEGERLVFEGPSGPPQYGDGMVPDDVDDEIF